MKNKIFFLLTIMSIFTINAMENTENLNDQCNKEPQTKSKLQRTKNFVILPSSENPNEQVFVFNDQVFLLKSLLEK
jgi:hypothetical protein